MKRISVPYAQAGHEPYVVQRFHSGNQTDREHPEELRSSGATIIRGPEIDPIFELAEDFPRLGHRVEGFSSL